MTQQIKLQQLDTILESQKSEEAMMKKVIDTALTSFAETPLTKGGNLEQAAEINITSRDDEL